MKFIALAAAALMATASPALAQRAEGPYIGIQAGAVAPENTQMQVKGQDLRATRDLGWSAGGFAGYDFGYVRAELEGNYTDAATDQIYDPKASYDANGRQRTAGAMVNVFADYDVTPRLSVYAGPGAGVQFVRSKAYASNDCKSALSMRAVNASPSGEGCRPNGRNGSGQFAYQATAGVRYAVAPRTSIGVKYTFTEILDVRFAGDNKRLRNVSFAKESVKNHGAALTLTRTF